MSVSDGDRDATRDPIEVDVDSRVDGGYSADQAISEDECVEITPSSVRIRKVVLDAGERAKASRGRR